MDFDQFKERQSQVWSLSDYSALSRVLEPAAQALAIEKHIKNMKTLVTKCERIEAAFRAIGRELESLPNVLEAYVTSGQADVVCKIAATSHEDLQETLLPTCRAEEATLFVAIDGLMGVANSCHVMKAQHTTLMRMAGDYAQALDAARTAGDVTEFVQYLGPLLHGLYALARAHLESEDEAYLGLLEAMLSSAQAEALAGAYESSAEQASSDD